MRHLTNPDERPKTPAIERHPAPPIAAVRDDTRQLIASSIADNTRTAYAAALRTLDAAVPVDRQTDSTIADHIAGLHAAGAAPASKAPFWFTSGPRRPIRPGTGPISAWRKT